MMTTSNCEFPFSLRHFFLGALSREETASACLAMLLEGSEAFRRHFLNLAVPERAEALSKRIWNVVVEMDHVDVRMETEGFVILIENKLAAGAKQAGQLLKYYQRQRRLHSHSAIVAVFLAPRQLGMDEVQRTKACKEIEDHPDDCATHVSWNDVLKVPDQFSEMHLPWIRHVLDLIRVSIENAHAEKYPRIGERALLRDLMDRAGQELKSQANIRFRRWSASELEEVYAVGSPLSLAVAVCFPEPRDPPYTISGVVSHGIFTVGLRSYVGIARKVGKNSALNAWWRKITTTSGVNIGGIGQHVQVKNTYLECTRPLVGTEAEIVSAVIATWCTIELFFSQSLAEANIDLSIA
jgi:hypothetical protein